MDSMKKKARNNPQTYLEKKKFGGVGYDDSDSGDSDELDLANKSPMTKRRMKDDNKLKKVKKLGPCGTYLTLMKGFVCTACLYLPKAFVNGGWLFTISCLTLSGLMTIYCAMLLIEIK